jgi:hypothetical protein
VSDRFAGADELRDDGQLQASADLSIVNEMDVAEKTDAFLARRVFG